MSASARARALAIGLCVALPAPAPLLGLSAFATSASCACTRACCCVPMRPASGAGACHAAKPESRDARLRCNHAAPTLHLASTVAVCAPPTAASLDLPATACRDPFAGRPRDGLRAVDPPPPRVPTIA